MSGGSPDDKQKPHKSHTKLADLAKTEAKTAVINQAQQLVPTQNPADFNKMLVGEGQGREYLKAKIEQLIRDLQERQSIGKEVQTFVRSEGARKGWEQDNNQKAGLFSERGGEIEKMEGENEEEEGHSGKESNDKHNDSDSLKANIKSKKAFSMAINDKTMPPAIKRLSTLAQLILLCLIGIAISEYAVIYK